jgi:hypothetical protein
MTYELTVKFSVLLRSSSVKMSRIVPSSSLEEQKIYHANSQAIRRMRH